MVNELFLVSCIHGMMLMKILNVYPLNRLVEKLRPAGGIRHLDVAGGTGDVAFRVLRAIRAAESARTPAASQRPGSVVIADINPAMLLEGRKRAASHGVGALLR